MKYLITGAPGFIRMHTAKRLLEQRKRSLGCDGKLSATLYLL
ncbi:hypothetical protein BN1079_01952 [Pseudomonas saudiphocaensis]|uniref:Uncharacterized protein n=1 Tax=Pseudomonas saudiphocaensis TaxID=1499686 RepID=A0A078LQ25_9PSED|nr:hypothetical protein BN1079_01952 [Pseudomonas saudiphocaensis]